MAAQGPLHTVQSEAVYDPGGRADHGKDGPVGRISLLQPQLRGAELLVKYDESVENREYVPIAQVEEADLEILKKAGKEQWKATSRTREIIFVEFEKEEA